MSEAPVRNLTDGTVKAAIWRQTGPDGPFYTVSFTKSYTDAQGQWQDSQSFGSRDLLKLSHLAGKCYDAIKALQNEDKAKV